MNMWKRTASSAALLLLATAVTAATAMADEPVLIVDPPPSSLKFVEIAAKHTLPAAILMNGQLLTLDRQPLIKEESLMVPLRFIAEAAGAKVEWNGATQSITVTMADRTATFGVGQAEAELNQRGVFYIKRNMIKMAMPVQVIEGRTLISADALTQILGLLEREDADLNMDLLVHPAAAELPNAKVKAGDAQVTPTVVAESALPEELRAWSGALTVEQAASYKVVTTDDGVLVGIAGGMQTTGGYRIELIGDARLVDGIWQIDAKVLAPEGMATQVLTNPVAFFKLPGVKGNVHVRFWTNGATP
jgi:hypothetical protein